MDGCAKRRRVGRPKKSPLDQRREGIRAQVDFPDARWWTRDGVAFIERLLPAPVLRLAKNYARSGKILEVVIKPGLAEAKVQGRRKAPYHVRLHFHLPNEDDLREVKRRLFERASYGALLLAGEMPAAIEDVFLASGVPFLPLGTGKERFFCSCPEPDDFCKHIVATLYTIIGIFDRNPFLLLKLRGIEGDDLLASLLAPRGGGRASGKEADALGDSAGRREDMAIAHADFASAPPFAPDASFYGDESSCRAIVDFQSGDTVRTDMSSSAVPMFDFPLWYGEIPFRESIDPYYESARKFFRGK